MTFKILDSFDECILSKKEKRRHPSSPHDNKETKSTEKNKSKIKRKDNKVRKIHSTKFHAKLSENTSVR
jgi:hypothetical protein